jgi:hypothetical protein
VPEDAEEDVKRALLKRTLTMRELDRMEIEEPRLETVWAGALEYRLQKRRELRIVDETKEEAQEKLGRGKRRRIASK